MDYLYPNNNFFYMWVGNMYNLDVVEHDIDFSGYKGRVILTQEQSEPFQYYKIFDVFVSCSKEESFGLSAIEAAALQKPLVCFEKTGGLEEIVKGAENITVPYLDIVEMAKKIFELYSDPKVIKDLGLKASYYATQFDENVIMPEFEKIINAIVEPIAHA